MVFALLFRIGKLLPTTLVNALLCHTKQKNKLYVPAKRDCDNGLSLKLSKTPICNKKGDVNSWVA